MMSPQELLEEVKDGLPAPAWSSAVQWARDGSVLWVQQEDRRLYFEVQPPNRFLPFRVELDLGMGDWYCPCKTTDGTCSHVAAAAIFLHQGVKKGQISLENGPGAAPVRPRGEVEPPGRAAPAPVPAPRVPVTPENPSPTPPPTRRAPTVAGKSSAALSPSAGASSASTLVKLRQLLRVRDGRYHVESYVLREGQPPQLLVTPSLPTHERVSAGDGQVLALKRLGLLPERIPALLNALALCAEVWVEDRPVKVRTEPLRPILVAEDHPKGLVVRLTPSPQLLEQLRGAPPLALVQGEPAELRPIGPASLPRQELELYERGRLFSGPNISDFFTHVLPRLQSHIQVELRTRQKPEASEVRPYARLVLTPGRTAGSLEVMAQVVYGAPAKAVVVGEKLHLLQGTRGLPHRHPGIEKTLSAQLLRLGLEPSRSRTLAGEELLHFVKEVYPRFPGMVENPHLAQRVKLHSVALQARWECNSTTGELELAFTLPPEENSLRGLAQLRDPHVEQRSALSAAALLEAYRQGSSLVPLLDGGFARLPTDWFERFGDVLEALLETDPKGPEAARAPLMARLMEDAAAAPDAEKLKQALLSRHRVEPVAVPEGLQASLRRYQLEGYRWLLHLEQQGLGAILADDMGLGKTLQTLAVILRDGAEAGPTLVVAPTSVLDNWAREAQKFTPSLKVKVYHGDKRTVDDLRSAQLVITSYAILRLDQKDLQAVGWRRVILDEAQAIKNPDSQAAKAACSLKAPHRLALTGTPVENRLAELWSILEFVNPGVMGSRSAFEALYSSKEQPDARAVMRLRARVQPFLLRRHKQEVAQDLPGKTEVVLKARLSKEERRVYDAVRSAGRKEVQKLLEGQGLKRHTLQVLEILLRLRQACCHAGLVPGGEDVGRHTSSKVKLLVEQLEVVLEEGHKALVFSQWTSLLDRVEPALQEAGISWVRLDGSTRDRAEVVARFQAAEGPGVFLISLKAGGTGLNLTAADYVYHLDPWWNPAVEDQATDRAYRIGQTRPVVVNRLIAADSIEEQVLKLQEQKRAIADAALGGDGSFLSALSEGELLDLLGG